MKADNRHGNKNKLYQAEAGANLVEYALLAVFIAVVAVVAVRAVGVALLPKLSLIASGIGG